MNYPPARKGLWLGLLLLPLLSPRRNDEAKIRKGEAFRYRLEMQSTGPVPEPKSGLELTLLPGEYLLTRRERLARRLQHGRP